MIFLNWLFSLWLALLPASASPFYTSTSAYAGTASNNMGYGTLAWTDVTSYQGASNGGYAYVNTIVATTVSNYLRASNFGFAIPGGATINGVTVTINGFAYMSMGSGSISWNRVRLMDGNLTVGTNDKATGNIPPDAPADMVFGGAADTWGGDATGIDWNDSDSGVVVAVRFDGISQDSYALLDSCQIEITYTEAAPYKPRRTVIGRARNLSTEKQQGVSF